MPTLRSAKRPQRAAAKSAVAKMSGAKKVAKKSAAKKKSPAFKYNRDVRLSAKRAKAVDKNCVCKVGSKTFRPFQLGSRTQVKSGNKKAVVPKEWLAGGARRKSGARRSGARKSGARRSGARKSGARRSGARK
jgi:hypothetical protein